MNTYRASALGSCTRAQIALQLGAKELTAPDRMLAIYERGNIHEDECVTAMEADGWVLSGAQDEVTLFVAGAQVVGHLDGYCKQDHTNPNAVFVGLGPRRVLEIKSPISWGKWERAHKTGDYTDPLMNRYAWQISVYMVATGLEAVIACVEDGQVRTFGIEVPPFNLTNIELRVDYMERCVAAHDIPGTCPQKDWPCPVADCPGRLRDTVVDPELDRLLGQYAIAKVARDEVDRVLKEVREAVDAHLGILDKLATEHGTATRVTTKRTTYDTKAMLKDG